MSTLQLVKRSVDGHLTVNAVPVSGTGASPTIEPEESVLSFGSTELVRLAVRLRSHGFRVNGVTMTDLNYGPLNDNDELHTDIVRALQSVPDVDSVGTYAAEHLKKVLILAISLERRKPAFSTIRITQNGSISVPNLNDGVIHELKQMLGDS